jgi:hypothetical protein
MYPLCRELAKLPKNVIDMLAIHPMAFLSHKSQAHLNEVKIGAF